MIKRTNLSVKTDQAQVRAVHSSVAFTLERV